MTSFGNDYKRDEGEESCWRNLTSGDEEVYYFVRKIILSNTTEIKKDKYFVKGHLFKIDRNSYSISVQEGKNQKFLEKIRDAIATKLEERVK